MSVKLCEIKKELQSIAPLEYACSWDNSGMNVEITDEVCGILICLDATKEIVLEAVKKNCNLIISHHPLLFNGIKKVDKNDAISEVLRLLVKNDISLYCCHTPADSCIGGINYYIGKKLGLENIEFLEKSNFDKFSKVVVTAPFGYEEQVKSAMFESGAGCIGEYGGCAYSNAGKGQFTPGVGTSPFIGKQNVPEVVDETRIEVVCPKEKAGDVVRGIINSHPYEEPAIDVFDLAYPAKNTAGMGIIGDLPSPKKLREFADKLKEVYKVDILRICGNLDGEVKRIALCGGSAGEFIPLAKKMGADVYITGEVKHNQYVEAVDIAVVEGGHYDTEKCFADIMYERLQNIKNELQYNVDILKAEEMRRPFVNY